jgi:hypothetical protein
MGHKRAVVYKKRRITYEEDVSDRDEGDRELKDDEDEINPYEDIKLVDLLAPITHPSQVPTHPAISRSFKSTITVTLAKRALEVICDEQENVVKFSKLMSVFLGDDPSFLLHDKLNLPLLEGRRNSTGKSEGELDDTNSRRTRHQTLQELDPFFALPQVNVDRNYGISPENAEETRQLTQIAQQRLEEFIRCMVQIRSGLLRADRFTNQLYRWCKEMNGEDDLDDDIARDPLTGPPVPISNEDEDQ